MNITWQIFEIAVNIFEDYFIIEFISKFLGYKYQGTKRHIGFFIFFLTHFINVTILNSYVPFEGIAIMIPVLINFVYAHFFLNGNKLIKLFASMLVMAVIILINGTSATIVSAITGVDILTLFSKGDIYRFTFVIITKVLFFVITRLFLITRNRIEILLGTRDLMPATGVYTLSIISMVFIIEICISTQLSTIALLFAFGAIICTVITGAITFYMLYKLSQSYEIRMENELLRQMRVYEIQHYEDTKLAYEQARSIRHDLKNILICTIEWLRKGIVDKALAFLEGQLGAFPDSITFIETDNEVLNYIVNTKGALCDSLQIETDFKILNDLKELADVDVSILLGNMLDNAIEGTKKQDSGRKISLYIVKQNGFIQITVKNTIVSSVLEQNPQLATTKREKVQHGIGVSNIRRIANQYSGDVDYYEENSGTLFCCSIMLQPKLKNAYYNA